MVPRYHLSARGGGRESGMCTRGVITRILKKVLIEIRRMWYLYKVAGSTCNVPVRSAGGSDLVFFSVIVLLSELTKGGVHTERVKIASIKSTNVAESKINQFLDSYFK